MEEQTGIRNKRRSAEGMLDRSSEVPAGGWKTVARVEVLSHSLSPCPRGWLGWIDEVSSNRRQTGEWSPVASPTSKDGNMKEGAFPGSLPEENEGREPPGWRRSMDHDQFSAARVYGREGLVAETNLPSKGGRQRTRDQDSRWKGGPRTT